MGNYKSSYDIYLDKLEANQDITVERYSEQESQEIMQDVTENLSDKVREYNIKICESNQKLAKLNISR